MQPGTLLGNRYRIESRIGDGGMALVYRAEDVYLGRPVAVKVLRPQFSADEDLVRRFRREAQAAASLSHPNVVSIYDVGEENDQYYIVMELLTGPTLKTRIQAEGPLPIPEVVRITLAILDALAHAHANRIVHRDIKPHNILLAEDGRVKVTDFGIARAVPTDTMTHTGSILGSAHYFSPEAAKGRPADEQSDIYSLGVVLYEMLTGVVPFTGDSPIAVALKHVDEEPLPPAGLNPEIPAELQEIVLRCLAKDPKQRYASATAMRRELERFADAYAAGRTHSAPSDFPTQDLRRVRERTRNGKGGAPVHGGDGGQGTARAEAPWHRRIPWSLVVLLVFLGAAAYAANLGIRLAKEFFDVPDVRVPGVVGLPLTEAEQRLRSAGLRMRVEGEETHNTLPPNYVTWQSHEADMTVKLNREIGVRVSSGPAVQTVPNLIGWTRAEAENHLVRLKLKAVVHQIHSREVPEGYVAQQDPPAGAQAQEGQVVDLFVSRGPLVVPNVTGRTLEEAQRMLTEQGLKVGQVTERTSARAAGTVVDQEPKPPAELPPGAPVDLVVSTGQPDLETGEKAVDIEVRSSQAGYVQVEVVLTDAAGRTTIHNQYHRAGDKFTVVARWIGDQARLTVLVNGTPSYEIPLP